MRLKDFLELGSFFKVRFVKTYFDHLAQEIEVWRRIDRA